MRLPKHRNGSHALCWLPSTWRAQHNTPAFFFWLALPSLWTRERAFYADVPVRSLSRTGDQMTTPKMPERERVALIDGCNMAAPRWDYVEWLESRVKEARVMLDDAREYYIAAEEGGDEIDRWLAATKDVP
jgi:hypothetical protein